MGYKKNINNFDENSVGIHNGCYFGMPFSVAEADLVLVSVPWDVTSSYGDGSARAPEAMIEASVQLDFYDPWAPGAWRRGIATVPVDEAIYQQSNELRECALKAIEAQEAGWSPVDTKGSAATGTKSSAADEDVVGMLEKVNVASGKLNGRIYSDVSKLLRHNKIVGLVGGDHSTPLGLIRAIGDNLPGGANTNFGILHLDAHCDLREAYEGFEHSHASIMYSVVRDVPQVERLVQVGVRDFSEQEMEFARNNHKIRQFTGAELSENEFRGVTWASQCERIVSALPQMVYVSFDIDFLSPEFCPGTGTPVPGGRTFDEAAYLLKCVVDSGRRIVGFDLCEISPRTSLDASIGARMLFKLCGQALRQELGQGGARP